jgi:hypothetical protein
LKAIKFPQVNVVIGEGQNDYQELPAFLNPEDANGTIVACFELTKEEVKALSESKQIWVQLLTFGNPLQPFILSVGNPFKPFEASTPSKPSTSDNESVSGESKMNFK